MDRQEYIDYINKEQGIDIEFKKSSRRKTGKKKFGKMDKKRKKK